MGQVWRDIFPKGSKNLSRKTDGMVHFGSLGKEMETWSLGQEKSLPTMKERRNHQCFIQHWDVKCTWTTLLSRVFYIWLRNVGYSETEQRFCVFPLLCGIGHWWYAPNSHEFHWCTRFEVSLAFFRELQDLGVSCRWWLCLIYTACKYIMLWIGAGNPIAELQTVCRAKRINTDIFCSCKGSKPISPCWEIILCQPISSYF